jgi:hypothetical protein
VENAKKRFAARYNSESNESAPVPAPRETSVAALSDEERLRQAEQHKAEGA